jgi:hypothetical protein
MMQDLLLGLVVRGIANTSKIKSRQSTKVSVGLPSMDSVSITLTPRFSSVLRVQTTCTIPQRTITPARMLTPEVRTRVLIASEEWKHSMCG